MDLTRRLIDKDRDTWKIMCADIHVGTISRRSGQPNDEPPWEWHCGFYPGCAPGQFSDGVAESFDEARAAFQEAWGRLLPALAPDAFERHREWRAEDRIRWQRIAEGWKPPPFDGWMDCACGVRFNSWDLQHNLEHVPHITAARKSGTWAKSW